jgi:hypothetical protein
MRFEQVFTSRNGFGIETATPLQRAVCRAADGEALGDELWREETVRAAFGISPPSGCCPDVMVVLAAIRSAKSTLAAARAFVSSQTVDLTGVRSGDEIRIPILSTDKDSARATFTHLAGAIMGSKALRSRVIGHPTTDTLWLRHPQGAPIEIRVTALARYGSTVISRWLAGIIFDEAPRMSGEEDAVLNLTEAMRASAGRILPGGQTWLVGSPYAPLGPVYELAMEHGGRPSKTIVVIRAPGPAMNPIYWTPERCEGLKTKDPKAYQTDVLAQFADPEEALFASSMVERQRRTGADELPPVARVNYVACIDPATRNQNWTLVILGNYGNVAGPGGTQPLLRTALAKQWCPETLEPMKADAVLGEIAAHLRAHRLDGAFTLPRTVQSIYQLALRHGVTLSTSEDTDQLALTEGLSVPLAHGTLELAPHRGMRNDLVGVRKVLTPAGHRLVLPRTGDGRHADFVMPLATCVQHAPKPPEPVATEHNKIFREHMARFRESANSGYDDACRRLA